MELNTILFTKDGRVIGNAIVIKNEGGFNEVKTDYGNTCVMSDKEIEEVFYISDKEQLYKHKYSV